MLVRDFAFEHNPQKLRFQDLPPVVLSTFVQFQLNFSQQLPNGLALTSANSQILQPDCCTCMVAFVCVHGRRDGSINRLIDTERQRACMHKTAFEYVYVYAHV